MSIKKNYRVRNRESESMATLGGARTTKLYANKKNQIKSFFKFLIFFHRDEADKYIHMGILNAIFVLGRTTGFIGHYVDQRRLDQGLYRHPWDDIAYIMPE
jgi:hypothetical protein